MRQLSTQKDKKDIERIKDMFFVFDVETTKLEPQPKNFVFGVLYGNNFQKVIYSVESFKKEFKKKKYRGKHIFAHNAEFDLTTVYGNIYKNLDHSAIFNGKFIKAENSGVKFADSLNIFPASVEKIGETVGLHKIENKKVSGEKLNKKNIDKDDIEYCIRDCEIIFNALLKIFEYVGSVKLTLSSLALFNFRNKFLKETIYYSELVDHFFNSYYGGRTEVFRLGKCEAKVYDINSLYPFVMSDMYFPDVKNLKHETKLDLKYFAYIMKNFEGMAKCKIIHKDHYFGFLPHRYNNKLCFPVGTFTGYWNFNEIRFALKHNIIQVLEVYEIVYGNPVFTPFKEFVNFHYAKRLETNDELEKLIEKLLQNALYGRFGMKQKYNTTYYESIPFEIISELDKTEAFYSLKTFSEKRPDCFLVTENTQFKNSFFSIAAWSSYITSQARIEILKGLLLNQENKIVYCDTDSIFLESDFIGRIDKDIGNYKLEEKTVLEIRGLKNYVLKDSKGNIKEVIKGISKNSVKVGEGRYKVKKYYKTKQSLRQNKESGEQFEQVKELKHKYDKRIVLTNGQTKPIKL